MGRGLGYGAFPRNNSYTASSLTPTTLRPAASPIMAIPKENLHQLFTTFLITNLHCPSCVTAIQTALKTLHPKPLAISPSIVSRSITVTHNVALSAADISKALEDAGFEVYDIFQDSLPDENIDHLALEERFGAIWTRRFQLAVENWRRIGRRPEAGNSRARMRHIEKCEECQAEAIKEKEADVLTLGSLHADEKLSLEEPKEIELKNAARKPTDVEDDPSSNPFVVIDSSSNRGVFQASFLVEGMTCSSCVGNITSALNEKPWVHSADIALLTNSASVKFEGKEHLDDIITTIDDAGYSATVEQVEEITPGGKSHSSEFSNTWKASYAIGGMTCSSCVGNITTALQQHGWITSADVNLISNSAMVVFDGKDNLAQIREKIEDAGYSATLDSVVNVGQLVVEDAQRKISIRVEGMYCSHCPSRIVGALDHEYGEKVKFEKVLTTDDPIMRIEYLPNAPSFTIRHIIASISAVDKAFRTSINHPPTLEERARQMQIRERRHVLFRLALSVTAAIPTFIIGIVLMNLVSSTNSSRQYISKPIWAGRVSRAEWAMFLTATPVYFFAADAFHRPAIKELRALWRPGSTTPIARRFYRFGSMNMLMSLGTTIAYFSSVAELAISASQSPKTMSIATNSSYFDSVVFLTMFLLFGRFLEAYSKAKTGDAVTLLGKLRPSEAILIHPSTDSVVENGNGSSGASSNLVPVDLLDIGDEVKVLYGGSPPSDGVITSGDSTFDEASLTGESRLVPKSIGDEVFSGTINKGKPVSVQISSVSGSSMLDQIVKVVREGQTRRAPIERVADVITSHFVPLVVLFAVSTWIIWLSLGLSESLPKDYLNISTGGWPLWSLQFAIAVFVIACPCGIGLAAPTALFVGGGLAAQHGILAKGGGEAFQEASSMDCIVFDKTGTLTEGGEPAITDHAFLAKDDEQRLLSIAKILEASSSHPVAKAIVSFCNSREPYWLDVSHVEEFPGKGIKGSVASKTRDGHFEQILVGNEAFMADHCVPISEHVIKKLDVWKTRGNSIALLAVCTNSDDSTTAETDASDHGAWRLAVMFAASDPLRPDAAAIVSAIQTRGIQVWMLSGDNPITARSIAQMVGIPAENVIAGVLPDGKAEKIQYLQKSLARNQQSGWFLSGKTRNASQRAIVAMVGDGINDSPALTMADVGIAVGSGSDVAISSAEFVLVSSNLASLLTLIDLSKTIFRRVKFNFLWALIYNLIALPIAAGVLYPVKSRGAHVRLDPVWASLAMALSSVSVVCSSLLLKSRLPLVGFKAKDERSKED